MHWFWIKNIHTGLHDGKILPNILAFHRDNVLKLSFVRWKKVHILTKEVNAKYFGDQSQKNVAFNKK